MNNSRHYLNLCLAAFIAILIWTVAFIYVPSHTLISIGYGFGLLGLLLFFGTMLLLLNGTKASFIARAAFPLQAQRYVISNLAFTIVVALLLFAAQWSMPTGVFVVIHLLLIGFFLWKILAMDSGQVLIERTEQQVAEQTDTWRMLRSEAEVLLTNAPAPYRKELTSVRDVIRFADPRTVPALEPLNQEIAGYLEALKSAVAAKKDDEVVAYCGEVINKVQERCQKLKTLK